MGEGQAPSVRHILIRIDSAMVAGRIIIMLRIGKNQYVIVDANSGISVQLFPPGESVFGRQQVWELDAHFVPELPSYTPRPDGQPEYLQLWLRAENYQVSDWCKLSGFDSEDPMIMASLRNRLVGGDKPEDYPISIDKLTIKQAERLSDHPDDAPCDFLFYVTIKGVCELSGSKLKLKVNTLLAFKETIAYVPLNAADPASTAKAMAKKIIKLDRFAGNRVTPYNPQRPAHLNLHINSHHKVTLKTASD